mmetsp:Transcript_46968/g.118894  ORF Transcript_46968/g.118894 Transcript_46968/m.118894 type:complete len:236 (-) Transcript_46968:444-1151(-)
MRPHPVALEAASGAVRRASGSVQSGRDRRRPRQRAGRGRGVHVPIPRHDHPGRLPAAVEQHRERLAGRRRACCDIYQSRSKHPDVCTGRRAARRGQHPLLQPAAEPRHAAVAVRVHVGAGVSGRRVSQRRAGHRAPASARWRCRRPNRPGDSGPAARRCWAEHRPRGGQRPRGQRAPPPCVGHRRGRSGRCALPVRRRLPGLLCPPKAPLVCLQPDGLCCSSGHDGRYHVDAGQR